MEKKQKFKARLGLVAVGAILLGCLGILMLPAKAEGTSTPAESQQHEASDQAQPASHTTAPKL